MSGDFQYVVDADLSAILRGFQEIEDRAAKAGQKIAENLTKGIQGFSDRSLAALYTRLNKLESFQFKIGADTAGFDKLETRIKIIKGLIDQIMQRKLIIGIDDRTIDGLQAKLNYLRNVQGKVNVDTDASKLLELERQIQKILKQLELIDQQKIVVDADANSILAITTRLKQELKDLQDKQIRIDFQSNSEEFAEISRRIEAINKEIKELEQKPLNVNVDTTSLQALRNRLNDLQDEQLKLGVDDSRLKDLQREIDETKSKIESFERNLLTINVDPNSFTAVVSRLEAQLRDLERYQVSINMDDSDVVELARYIKDVKKQLDAIENKKITIDADANSILAITTRLKQDLKDIKDRQIRIDIAANKEEFDRLGREARDLEKQIARLDQLTVDIDVDVNSLQALQARLNDLENEQIKISADKTAFGEIEKEITSIKDQIKSIQDRKVTINVDANSFLAVTQRLENELQRLEKDLISINMDDKRIEETAASIRDVKSELDKLQQRKTTLSIDINGKSIDSLQAKLQGLISQQAKIDIEVDPTAFRNLERQIVNVRRELDLLDDEKITIDADANSILEVTTRLRRELADLDNKIIRIDIDSPELAETARKAQELRDIISRFDRLTIDIDVQSGSLQALENDLRDLESKQVKLRADTADFAEAQRAIEALERQIDEIKQKKVTVNVDANSFTAVTQRLEAELQRLQKKLVSINMDDSQIRQTKLRIDELEGELNKLQQRKILITADPSSILALKTRLTELQRQLETVGTGSSAFRGLQTEIRKTQVELDRATASGSNLKSSLRALTTAIVEISIIGGGTVLFAKTLTDAAIASETAQVRLKALADQYGETEQAQAAIEDSARKLNLTTTEAAEGFLQLYGVLRPSGVSLESVKNIFTGTAAAAKNFGLTTEEVKGALVQLRQALAGDFQTAGQELNSILEQLPPVAKAIADEVGMTVGQLKEFAKEGNLTSDVVITAIEKLNDVELARLATTLDSSRERLKTFGVEWNKLSITIGQVALSIGLPIVESLNKIVGAINGAVTAFQKAPGSIKAFLAVVIGVPAAIAAGTIAIQLFQAAIASTTVTAAIANVAAFAAAMRNTLTAAATIAAVAVAQFGTALKALTVANAISAISSLSNALKGQLVGAVLAAATSLARLIEAVKAGTVLSGLATGLKAAAGGLAVFAKATWAALAPWAPLLLIIGAVAAAIATYKAVFGGADQVTEDLAEAQNKSAAASNRLNAALGETTKTVQGQGNAFQQFFSSLGAGMELIRVQQEVEKLGNNLDATADKATEFLKELQNGKAASGEFKANIIATISALEAQGEAAKQSAEALRRRAEALDARGETEAAEALRQYATGLEAGANRVNMLADALRQKAGIQKTDIQETEQSGEAQKRAEEAVKKRAEAEAELNRIIAEAPVRAADNQLKVGQELLNLSKALSEQEQSRFDIVKSALGFQLKQAEDRKASEFEIKQIKDQINAVDVQAAQARYQALIAEQGLQRQLLEISQQKARLEAEAGFKVQQLEVLKAQAELSKANTAEEKAAAEANLILQREILGIKGQQIDLLKQVQPIETAVADANRQTAINAEAAKLAQLGYKVAADGSLQAINSLVTAGNGINVVTTKNAEAQDLIRRYAQDTGTALQEASSGALVLGTNQELVKRVTDELNTGMRGTVTAANDAATAAGNIGDSSTTAAQQIKGIATNFGSASNAAGDTAQAAKGIGTSIQGAKGAIDNVESGFDGAKSAATKTAQEAGKIGTSIGGASRPASDIATAFTSTGKSAPKAAQGARDFAGWLSKAKGFASQIGSMNLDGKMNAVANRTRAAADQAWRFYDALKKASGLPGARWSGGPVEAGEAYRVNELGPESLLSGGVLRMINAPANSIWRAPSSGVVIPAGVTSRLREQGAIQGTKESNTNLGLFATRSDSLNAELAIEIGKLRAEVAELARKDWNVNVTTKTGPSGSQVMRSLLR